MLIRQKSTKNEREGQEKERERDCERMVTKKWNFARKNCYTWKPDCCTTSLCAMYSCLVLCHITKQYVFVLYEFRPFGEKKMCTHFFPIQLIETLSFLNAQLAPIASHRQCYNVCHVNVYMMHNVQRCQLTVSK